MRTLPLSSSIKTLDVDWPKRGQNNRQFSDSIASGDSVQTVEAIERSIQAGVSVAIQTLGIGGVMSDASLILATYT